jgi:hypothetical protein
MTERELIDDLTQQSIKAHAEAISELAKAISELAKAIAGKQ